MLKRLFLKPSFLFFFFLSSMLHASTMYTLSDIHKVYPVVDDAGNLLSPVDANYAKEFVLGSTKNPFNFGDEGPTETAWRRSSGYPFTNRLAIPGAVAGAGVNQWAPHRGR